MITSPDISRAGLLLGGLIAALGTTAVRAQNASASIGRTDLTALAYRNAPNLPGVAAAAVLRGFDQAGLYVVQGQMAAGSRFPSHRHPDERLTIVTSGIMHLGEGEVFDETKLVAYPVGTLALTPAGTFHYMLALSGAVTMLEIGAGPSGTVFAA